MPPVAVWVLTFGGSLLALRARLRIALGVFLATIFLIPAGVLVPGLDSRFFPLHRLVLLALTVNLIRHLRRRDIPLDVLRPTRIHAALAAWLVVSFVLGVTLAEVSLPIASPLFLWLLIVDQAIMFVVVLAVVRVIDDPWGTAKILVAVFLATAAIAVWEHYFRVSYGEWFFRRLPANVGASGELPLQLRGGQVRVRSAVQFSLAYAWIATLLLPLVIVVASRARRAVMRFAPAIVGVSIIFTLTRSAYVWAAVSVLLLVAVSRLDGHVTKLVAVGAILVALMLAGSGTVERTFAAEGPESVQIRGVRTPLVLEQAAKQPFIGGGLAGLVLIGFKATDATLLLTYADMGVIGLAFFVLLLIAVLAGASPGMRGPPGRERALACAVFVGLVAALPAAGSFDEFQILPAFTAFWVLAAIGVRLAERASSTAIPAVHQPGRRLLRAAMAGVVGVGIGLGLLATVPRADAMTIRFTTVAVLTETQAQGKIDFVAGTLVNSACQVMTGVSRRLPDTAVSCQDLITGTGMGQVRLVVERGAPLERRARMLLLYAHRAVPTLRAFLLETNNGIRPTWARTAPVWAGIGALGLSFGVGPRRERSGRWRFRSLLRPREPLVPRSTASIP